MIPIPVLVAGIITLVFHYLLSSTKFGLYVYAMGGKLPIRRAGGGEHDTAHLYAVPAQRLYGGDGRAFLHGSLLSGGGGRGRAYLAERGGGCFYRRC